MSQMGRNVSKLVALVFAAAVAVGITEVAVEAKPGDVLKGPVNIPSAALCPGGSRTALAVVSGGKAGYPQIPGVLLVTSGVGTVSPTPPSTPQSCVSGTDVNLFLLDPLNPAFVKALRTVFPASPPRNSLPDSGGWKALALRADKGDLLACGTTRVSGNTVTVLWSVDFSPFNPTSPEGTATFLGSWSGSSCDAIAWDATDKTKPIFQAVGTNVFHMTETGTNSTSMAISGCTTSITGLGVAGTSLFVGCANKIQQVDKATGTVVRTFTGVSVNPVRGLPDDPTTFAPQYQELLWILNASSNQLVGVEIPGGTIGQLTGAPVLFPGVGSGPNACPTGTQDTDGDGLLDCWEDGSLWSDGQPGISYNGIYDGNILNRDVVLCVTNPPVPTPGFVFPPVCADKANKDIFVEIDYMLNHYPDLTALGQVMDVFRLAPTPPGSVRLHIQLDEQIPHYAATALVPCTVPAAAGEADFDLIKLHLFPTASPVGGFGTGAERSTTNGLNAKALAFRYGLFVHNLSPSGNTSSGCSEIGGNDFVVSLGSFTQVPLVTGHNVGTTDQQAGTFLHELSHTLGLRHGGGDNINCKPNYVSVMNYSRQFDTTVPGRLLELSSEKLITLNKSSLNESSGVLPLPASCGVNIAFGPVVCSGLPITCTSPTLADACGAIDWNNNGVPDSNLGLDITYTTSSSGGCPANQKDAASGQVVQILEGYDDWEHMQFNFRGSLDYSGGARNLEQKNIVDDSEQTFETAAGMSRDRIDIKPNDRNNTINRKSSQTIGVAIFGRPQSNVDPGLDVNTIIVQGPDRLILRGTGGATWVVQVNTNANGCTTRDVDNDDQLDLICDFTIPANTVGPQERYAVIEGIAIVPPDNHVQRILALDFIRVQ